MKRSELLRHAGGLLQRHDVDTVAADPLVRLLELLAAPDAPTSVHDPRQGLDVHVADSLSGFVIPELRTATVIADLGSGGGLPGLVIAAVRPDSRVVLVESHQRKCAFLRAAAAEMGLANVEVVSARAEEWREGVGRCDVVVARALASLAVVYEYAAPLLRDAGVLIAWKGDVAPAEAADGAAAAHLLGLAESPPIAVQPFAASERRTIWSARKVAPTPEGFPRRAGIASKRPLSVKNLR